MVTVKEIMKRDVVSVQYGAPVVQAAKMMRQRKIGSVFVRLEERVVGIVTEPDIVREVVGAERNPTLITVEDVMSFPVIEIEERSPLTEAADLMETCNAPPGSDKIRRARGRGLRERPSPPGFDR